MKQDLLELLIFETGDPPCRRPGGWAWVDLSERLPATDLAVVADLPAVAATYDSVVEATWRSRRSSYRAHEAQPPASGSHFRREFEQATLAFLERELGATIPNTT